MTLAAFFALFEGAHVRNAADVHRQSRILLQPTATITERMFTFAQKAATWPSERGSDAPTIAPSPMIAMAWAWPMMSSLGPTRSMS